ncbi:MAG: RnfABCDGE type electron transport complex subunit G [Bacteroides sp.]|nr:RnfABCDGE type electron transport complex subunit G [Roseburia sp.]MCM1347089.1 RnfABCDGE type electron transport complex subunit G [Bacteroides sp.]MCM1421610.1 RnfABCDGE type electron transport complex subunit G [Bacteroides sp.]
MKKLSSSLTNMAVVLTVIAIVAGGVLAYVNSVTAPQIEKINAENLAAGIKKVIGNDELVVSDTKEVDKYTIYTTTDKDGNILGTAISTSENGFGGPLQVLVGFDKEGTILGYTILSSAETPGLGAKAGLWFQKGEKGDIIGKNPGTCNFTVSKDGGDVDAITASTITSRAFLLAIQNAYNQLMADGKTEATSKAHAEKKENVQNTCQCGEDCDCNEPCNCAGKCGNTCECGECDNSDCESECKCND